MTKQQIADLIAAKISGQGSAVDVGGALPAILYGILELIPEAYTLPVASDERLGGVKVGPGLEIDDEHLLIKTGHGLMVEDDELLVDPTYGQADFRETNADSPSFIQGIFRYLSSWGSEHLLTDAQYNAIFRTPFLYYQVTGEYMPRIPISESLIQVLAAAYPGKNIDCVWGTYREDDAGVFDGGSFIVLRTGETIAEHIVEYIDW